MMFENIFGDKTKAKAATQKDHEKVQEIRDDRKDLNKKFDNSASKSPFKSGLRNNNLGETKGLGTNNNSLGSNSSGGSKPVGPKTPSIPNKFNSSNFQ